MGYALPSQQVGTGRVKVLRSPLTGRMQTYEQTLSIQAHEVAPTTPDLDAIIDRINSDLTAEGVDGFCDEILAFRGVFHDQYKTSVWVATEQPALARPGLIVPAVILAIAKAVAIVIGAIIVATGAYMVFSSAAAFITALAPTKPTYVTDTEDPTEWDTWTAYYTRQQALYWYVCPKCGAGFGEKALYASPDEVPESIVNLYNEHKATCLGIPKAEEVWWPTILAVGTVLVVAAIVIPPLLRPR